MTGKMETTLRAVIDGASLEKAKLPEPVRLKSSEANAFAAWARPIAGICLTDIDVMVSDVRPSIALRMLCDLEDRLARKIRPILEAAEGYGFALRLNRESNHEPYELSIVRRVIDAPQLTLSEKAMRNFLNALGLIEDKEGVGERTLNIGVFAETLTRRHAECMDNGVGHYAAYAKRVIEYGYANGATELIWGPERRGAVQQ